MSDPINSGGASSASHSHTAGTENQKPITEQVTVNGKTYNAGKAKVWGLRIARELLGVHGLIKPAYNHFHGKLHDHRADGNVSGTSTPPSTPLLERATRAMPATPNKVNEFTGSTPSATPVEVTPENRHVQPMAVSEIINALTFGGFEEEYDFSLSKFSETVQLLPTSEIKDLLVNHNTQLQTENVRQEVREIYAERKITEELANFDGDVQGLKEKFAKHYKSSPNLAAAMNAEINRQLNIQEAPDARPPELQELTPGLQSVYDSDSGAQLQHGLHDGKPLQLNQTFPSIPQDSVINQQFSNIEKQSPKISDRIDQKDDFKTQAFPKFTNIHLSETAKAFAPGAPYHAAKIDLPGSSFIAAQGPLEKTETNFIKLLAHHHPAVSVSLVNSDELKDPSISGRKNSKRSIEVGPKAVGEEKNYGGVKVKLDGMHSFDDGKVVVKQLSINGETQFRVYDKGWEDHSAGNPERLAKLSVLVEKLRQHPSVADRAENPTVVNCNAGVGRTGTFVTIDNSLREYQKTGTPPQDYTQTISTARQVRNKFVQTAGQLNTLAAVHGQFTPLFNPLLKEAGLTVATPVQTPVTPQEPPEPEDNGLGYDSTAYATINRDERDAGRIRKAHQDENYENTSFGQIRDDSIEEVSEEDDTLEPPPILTPSPSPDDIEESVSIQAPDSPPVARRTASIRPQNADQLLDKISEGGYGNTIQTFNAEKLASELTPVLRQADQGQLNDLLNYTETLKENTEWNQIGLAVENIINDHIQNRPPNAVDPFNRPSGQVRN
ncbi:tyrosine-protein phosphatase [Endozoicomonas numazuensis]|uniref:tyrosine-protein phosphatase n=1 Tax=Endozoicomonas numazuensis TaxID=1137799 RepID=UPI001376FE37|nr:tyrosine-protein phosphatase [Endozoicomonas numazuensis]